MSRTGGQSTDRPTKPGKLARLSCVVFVSVGRADVCRNRPGFFLPSCWLTRGADGFGLLGTPVELDAVGGPAKKIKKKIKQSARAGLIMALRKKKEKDKKKEFRSARAQNGAIRLSLIQSGADPKRSARPSRARQRICEPNTKRKKRRENARARLLAGPSVGALPICSFF